MPIIKIRYQLKEAKYRGILDLKLKKDNLRICTTLVRVKGVEMPNDTIRVGRGSLRVSSRGNITSPEPEGIKDPPANGE